MEMETDQEQARKKVKLNEEEESSSKSVPATTEGERKEVPPESQPETKVDSVLNREARRPKVPLAVWDDQQKLAWILENKGKFVNRMGFHVNQKQWLLPEEAAFLVSEGEMDLADQVSTNPLSYKVIEDLSRSFSLVYEGLSHHHVDLVDYYAFVALKKLRFNVFRTGEWAINLDTILSAAQEDSLVRIPSGEVASGVNIVLRYDAFSPQSNFNVTLRGTPPFQVGTTRPADCVPPVSQLRSMAKACEKKGTKMRIALFDGQGVSFVQIEDFNLQDISAALTVKPVVDKFD